MKVELVSIDSVIPYARNPRQNQGAVAKVAASLREYGWQQPIVVDKSMVVIVGHTRLLAARMLGQAKVPVTVADQLTPAQVRAYRIADNRVGEEAEWDQELLGLELKDLQGDGFNLALTGLDDDELGDLLGAAVSNGAGDDGDKAKSKLEGFDYRVVVECTDSDHQEKVLAKLEAQGYTVRALIS